MIMLTLTDDELAALEREALSTPADRRSLVYSVLKTQYGWDGVWPPLAKPERAEEVIAAGVAPDDCDMRVIHRLANQIALHLSVTGATWRPRIDGRPNTLRIVDGRLVVRAD